MKQRLAAPSDLVDLRHVAEMKGISVSGGDPDRGRDDPCGSRKLAEIAAACPGLAHLAAHIGDPHVRHMGTIGGSIANNDPAADYPAGLMALNATIVTNKRSISADEFFTGMFDTALEDGELIVAVEFNAPSKCGYSKFPNPASRYAMTGVFVAKHGDGSVRVAVTGAGSDGVFRHGGMEQALASDFSAGPRSTALTVDDSDLMSDIHASAAYRANLVKVMAKRAVARGGLIKTRQSRKSYAGAGLRTPPRFVS
jgi:carbon-monoxide dehydrogenase medium subunit